MILTAIFFSAIMNNTLRCPDTSIINNSVEWTEVDQRSLLFAETRCGDLYKSSPCLKVFVKKEFQIYNAICGRPDTKMPHKDEYRVLPNKN